ncbi:hypothetical protein [Corynebacterium ulceribovis]|uniref:hypothetical protein n=1 Tax=Corynebacterium ulceribovis TaxID=487732 RepID=UPI00036DAEA1|nr:hypothetical protein [Corynebacterium ulceribovis]
MTSEDLLTLADAVADELGTSVRSLPALVMIASLTTAHFGGVPLFRSEADRNRQINNACRQLRPLQAGNEVFAKVVIAVI